MKSTIENLRGLEKIPFMDNTGSRILKISLILVTLISFSGMVFAQDVSIDFLYSGVANNSELQTYEGEDFTNFTIGGDIRPNVTAQAELLEGGNSITGGTIYDLSAGSYNSVSSSISAGVGNYTFQWEVFTDTDSVRTDPINIEVTNETVGGNDTVGKYDLVSNYTGLGSDIRDVELTENYIGVGNTEGDYYVINRNTESIVYSGSIGSRSFIGINESEDMFAVAGFGNSNLETYNLTTGSLINTYNHGFSDGRAVDIGYGYIGIAGGGSTDGYEIYDIDSQTSVKSVSGGGSTNFEAVDISKDYILTGTNDGDIRVVNRSTLNQITSLGFPNNGVLDVKTRPDQNLIAFGSQPGGGLIDYQSLELIETYDNPSGGGEYFEQISLTNSQFVIGQGSTAYAFSAEPDYSTFANYTDATTDIRGLGSMENQFATGTQGGNVYVYQQQGLTFSNLRTGENTPSGFNTKNSFTEPESFEARIDYSGSGDGYCADFFMRPQGGWNPVPGGYNSSTWQSFNSINCFGGDSSPYIIESQNYARTPIVTTGDFPLNQSDTYEIFFGAFDGQDDPGQLESKSDADITSTTETFDVSTVSETLDATLNISSPGDNYVYSFQNATQGNIPYEFTIEGNQVVDARFTVYNTNGDVVTFYPYSGIDTTGTGFIDAGDFGVPQGDQVENGSYIVELNVTDGSTTLTETNTFILQENATETDQPIDDGGDSDGGDGDTDTGTGFFADLIGDIVGGIANFFGTLNQIVLDQLGTAGATIMALVISLIFAFIALISIELFIGTGSVLAGIGTFGTSIIAFVVGGWIPGWIIVTGTIITGAVLIWRGYNG